MKWENISAISTALSPSGVAVIRISGESPLSVAEKCFKPNGKIKVRDFEPNKMYVGEIITDDFTDYGMCVYFKAPKSFTGEDIVEFHVHGGLAITKGVLRQTLKCGARLAENGEFTKRAFMNGKLSLSSAEGLINMINAETRAGVKAGYSLYREKLNQEVMKMQDLLTDVLAGIDADMDFPEEDLENQTTLEVKDALNKVIEKIDQLLPTFKTGRSIVNGVKVGIVGRPNTGKSSLLNALLSYDKAIVSSIAGTTRDIVEGNIEYNGVRFNLYDTAGIRESGEEIEEMGVKLSEKIINSSDLILFIKDGTKETDLDKEIFEKVKDKNIIVVKNKLDKDGFSKDGADIFVSAKANENIEKLKAKMYDKTVGDVDLNGEFLCEERHFLALSNAKEKLSQALNAVGVVTLDILAIDIKDGWDYLGEISGKTATEDIIDNIFKKFCVGK